MNDIYIPSLMLTFQKHFNSETFFLVKVTSRKQKLVAIIFQIVLNINQDGKRSVT